jgi:hypothetical protein
VKAQSNGYKNQNFLILSLDTSTLLEVGPKFLFVGLRWPFWELKDVFFERVSLVVGEVHSSYCLQTLHGPFWALLYKSNFAVRFF